MKRMIFFILLPAIFAFLVLSTVSAEELSNLDEIVSIIQDSGRFDFHMTYFDKKIETEKALARYGECNSNQIIVEKDGKRIVEIYKPSAEVAKLVKDAEKAMALNEWDQAEKKLKKAKEMESYFFKIDVLIGEIAFARKKYQEAIAHFNKAINKNSVSFQAYKLRGDCHEKLGKLEMARDDYISALINNRNHKETWQALDDLGGKMGFAVYRDPFVPLYSIQKLETGVVRIYFDEKERARWMPYSFTKAVWKFQPGYFRKRTGKDFYEPALKEETECIRNMIWGYDAFRLRGDYKEDPFIERIKRIRSKFFLRDFIYFEVMSPENPEILLKLKLKFREDLKDYIKTFILVKK